MPPSASTMSTTLGQAARRVLVAGLVREFRRPAQHLGRRVHVAARVRLQPRLDRLGEFFLAGVVGDLRVDPGRKRLVIGPGRDDRCAGHFDLRAGRAVDDRGAAAEASRRPRRPPSVRRRHSSRATRCPRPRSGSRASARPPWLKRSVRTAISGLICLQARMRALFGVHSRRRTSPTARPRAPWMADWKSASMPAGSAMIWAVPKSRPAILRSWCGCQSVPTPRQSHWKTPSHFCRASSSGPSSSWSFLPSVREEGVADGVGLLGEFF